MDSVGATPSPRHPGHQFAAVLEKVHMPPASFDGVVNSTQSFADRALEMFPGTCSSRNSKRLGSPSKRHSATRHCRPNPSAAVKSSSGVILLIESTLTQNANPPPLFGTRIKYQQLLRLRGRSEERAKGYRTQNAVTFPARSEACSSEKRNKWRGPTKWGGGRLCGFDLEQA